MRLGSDPCCAGRRPRLSNLNLKAHLICVKNSPKNDGARTDFARLRCTAQDEGGKAASAAEQKLELKHKEK